MAELTYAPGPDRRFHPVWDTRIARLLTGPLPDLWSLFDALSHMPLLLIRGELSNILLPATVARMQRFRPDMSVVALPGIGHAPILTEPLALEALMAFLEQIRDVGTRQTADNGWRGGRVAIVPASWTGSPRLPMKRAPNSCTVDGLL